MTTILTGDNRRLSNVGISVAPSVGKAGAIIDFDALQAIEGAWHQYREQEVRLGRQLMPVEVDSVVQAGLTVVRRLQRVAAHVVETAAGRTRVNASTEERFYRAELHPGGTAANRLAREKAARVKKPPRPFAPATLDPPSLAAQPERVRSFASGALPVAAITPAAAAVRGREPVMAWLAKQEVILEPAGGHLLARVRGGMPSVPVREVLTAYAHLLPSWVAGRDVPCDVCGAAAVVPALLDAVLCEEHAHA